MLMAEEETALDQFCYPVSTFWVCEVLILNHAPYYCTITTSQHVNDDNKNIIIINNDNYFKFYSFL